MVGQELAYTGYRSRFYRHDSVSLVVGAWCWSQVLCIVYRVRKAIIWKGTLGTQSSSFFIRVMSSLYCLWDILDDLVFRKAYESDASKFAKLCGLSSQTWGVIWFLISLIFFVGAILIALVAFKRRLIIALYRFTNDWHLCYRGQRNPTRTSSRLWMVVNQKENLCTLCRTIQTIYVIIV